MGLSEGRMPSGKTVFETRQATVRLKGCRQRFGLIKDLMAAIGDRSGPSGDASGLDWA